MIAKVVCSWTLLWIIAGAVLTTASAQEMEPYVSPVPQIRALTIGSITLSNDGDVALFGRTDGVFLVERDSRIATPTDITPEATGTNWLNAAWSPDGRYLAYLRYDAAGARAVVWDRQIRTNVASGSRVVCDLACSFWAPAWTNDSRHIIYVAASLQAERANSDEPPISLADQIYGRVRPAGGVVVLQSPAARGEDSATDITIGTGLTSMCRGWCEPSEIVALDMETRRETVIARGHAFKGIVTSPDSRYAVAAASVPPLPSQRLNRYFNYYRVDLSATLREPASSRRSARATSSLQLLASNVPNFQVGRNLSFSADGRYVAYTDTGNSAGGDVWIVDLHTTRRRNLTAGIQLDDNPTDVNPYRPAGSRLLSDHVGRFGAHLMAPIWAPEGDAVFVVRPKLVFDTLRYHLWRVPLTGNAAHPLGMQDAYSIETMATCHDGHRSCWFGPERRLLASVRRRGDDGADRLNIVTIGTERGDISVLADAGTIGPISWIWPEYDLEGAAKRLFVVSQDGSRAIGLLAGQDAAPELWEVTSDVRAGQAVVRLGVLQTRAIAPITSRRIEFQSQSGDRLGVRVELPADYRPGEQLPAVMVVYGAMSPSQPTDFNGGRQWYDPLRDEGRFAIILPDLPRVAEENGANCDLMAANADAALDAALTTGWISRDRVGLIGHSWGGYSVFCITSRSDRFRAALSAAPLSNLVSMGISGMGGRGAMYYLAGLTAHPWDNPDWYVRETPGFRLNAVRTPLMIAYGVKDPIEPNHPYEIYSGLSELGQPTELIGYSDSGHAEMLSYADFWRRTFDWFDRYLQVTEPETSARPRRE